MHDCPQDSSDDSEAGCKGGSGINGKSGCCGIRGRGYKGEDGINYGDPMCSTCHPGRFSDCPCPRCTAQPYSFSETFIRSMMETTELGEARHRESAASAASIVGDGFFGWAGVGGGGGGGGCVDTEGSKAQRRGQGPSMEGSNCRNLESSSVGSSDWEFSSGAGEGGSGTGGGSKGRDGPGWAGSNDSEGGLVHALEVGTKLSVTAR